MSLDAAASSGSAPIRTRSAASSARQAYLILYAGFVALPVLAGLDKFFHLLVDRDRYLAPMATRIVPVTPHDIALRDFGLSLGALALTKLGREFGSSRTGS